MKGRDKNIYGRSKKKHFFQMKAQNHILKSTVFSQISKYKRDFPPCKLWLSELGGVLQT